MKILVVGGAGFIGRSLIDKIYSYCDEIVIVDNLLTQVHGDGGEFLKWKLNFTNITFIHDDVKNISSHDNKLNNIDVVFFFVSETGTGQSLTEMGRYAETNVMGLVRTLEWLRESGNLFKLRNFILSSTRAVYGEGTYICSQCNLTRSGILRKLDDLETKKFEIMCDQCDEPMQPVASSSRLETSPLSLYASTKLSQEHILQSVLNPLGVPFQIFRFQNVYGPYQSRSNPYTGIIAIFTALCQIGKDINVFEDGLESRDFIYIDDLIDILCRCFQLNIHGFKPIDVGTGQAVTVLDVAKIIKGCVNEDVKLLITGEYRVGDIRHNFADTEDVKRIFNKVDFVSFKDGYELLYKTIR